MDAKTWLQSYGAALMWMFLVVFFILSVVGAFRYGMDYACTNGGGVMMKDVQSGRMFCMTSQCLTATIEEDAGYDLPLMIK